ncbi:hypothetical protein MRX96_040800 [Rhipicephalus microplus]
MVSDDHRGHLFELDGIHTVRGVEKLKVTSSSITFKFATELKSLLRRNASTLKVVKLIKARLPRNVDYALRCLVNRESLTLHSYYDWDRRFPSLVAQLLHTSSALKELSIIICPIKKKKQVTTIAEAIKANTSLTKLSVFSGDILYSPEPIFAALLVNKTLKELQLQQCNFDAPCRRALAIALYKNTNLRTVPITESAISLYGMQLLAVVLKVNSTLEELELSSGEALHYRGICFLCASLAKNKTLKKLTLGTFRATKQERTYVHIVNAFTGKENREEDGWEEWRAGSWLSPRTLWAPNSQPVCLFTEDDEPASKPACVSGASRAPAALQPRHTRGRMSKGPQDGKSECEYMPGLESATPVPGNPALNLTLTPYEASGELCRRRRTGGGRLGGVEGRVLAVSRTLRAPELPAGMPLHRGRRGCCRLGKRGGACRLSSAMCPYIAKYPNTAACLKTSLRVSWEPPGHQRHCRTTKATVAQFIFPSGCGLSDLRLLKAVTVTGGEEGRGPATPLRTHSENEEPAFVPRMLRGSRQRHCNSLGPPRCFDMYLISSEMAYHVEL